MSPTPWDIQYAAQREFERQAAEAQQLLAQQQAAYQAQQVAGTAVPRNAEGFATALAWRAITAGTQVRYADQPAMRVVVTTSLDQSAPNVRTRAPQTMPRLRRPWLQTVLDSQNMAAQPPSER